ncbi:3-hydroxyacyl-CoA dehydrogenase NAD-binding domain-containing protein [Neobacillus citreus]|uniref:3-hydroxyacyl-CoA dehydrogenase NAD-binding domain-containing protein n=1 Tax=Neobacillus citreus TaxID=2833578 RepID=A0A942T1Y6_9BACI|nr:3-hydroxyacyl-CoA dehydrogenase NAD-binding domain-containing protein [Neobacillus citreus]MCH6264959.1 3-hydroxyacyl-CoA dehydrogenase NAD-binding domain-containing protein [Neobacillus citreus]
MEDRKITVVGAGTMGRGIAQLLAQNRVNVHMVEQNQGILNEAMDRIRDQYEILREYEFISEQEMNEALGRISLSDKLQDAQNSWMVIEAIPEVLELKQTLFQTLEEICGPATIFATNTSGLSINRISEPLKHRDRFIGTHFFMPAAIIPLVEIIRGDKTSDQVCDEVMQFFKKIHKEPVLIQKDIPGFIGNRIQHAMAREAISLLEEGIATAEEIDTVVRWSLGVRLLFTGPLEQRDLNGLDVHHHIASYLYKDLENRTEPSRLLSEKVQNGELGIKSGKGFYDWDKDSQTDAIQTKNAQLLQLMKWLKK